MSNVVDFPTQPSEDAFVLCPCDEENPAPFAVCGTQDEPQQVRFLKCPACGQEIPVTGGYIGGELTE
jgi:hypothetical protein